MFRISFKIETNKVFRGYIDVKDLTLVYSNFWVDENLNLYTSAEGQKCKYLIKQDMITCIEKL